jgi:hypothetical protein
VQRGTPRGNIELAINNPESEHRRDRGSANKSYAENQYYSRACATGETYISHSATADVAVSPEPDPHYENGGNQLELVDDLFVMCIV